MKCYERFLEYVKWETTSNPNTNTHPSNVQEFEFGKFLEKEMIAIGLSDVEITDKGYLYGVLKKNTDKEIPTIGFIAHMDTSFDCSGKDVKPIIHKNYDGNDLLINKSKNIYLKVKEYTFLKEKKGMTIITTDGTTLLGADDKAGISEILSMIEYIINNNIPHGDIKVAFTPDEEIGEGADFFDVKKFNADYAYTVDGGAINEVEYENFNAASATVTINGINIHPGSAKDKMVNSINIAYEFDNLLPKMERPQYTEHYEAFNHLNDIKGNVEKTTLNYIIRNHDMSLFTRQKEDFYKAKSILDSKYGNDTIELSIIDSYYNMSGELKDKMFIVERAKSAIKEQGLTPICVPIRGGTDGARLTFMGLPCPNLGTGGYNFHGRFECIAIEDMELMVNILVQIVKDISK